MQKLSHNLGKMCSKEEVIHRLNTFHSDINSKLERRIGKEMFNKVFKEIETKMENMESQFEL